MNDLNTMAVIMAEKEKDIALVEKPDLDAEGAALANAKRQTFDMPINVAKVDPLR